MNKVAQIIGKIFLLLLIIIFLTGLTLYFSNGGEFAVMETVEQDSTISHITIDNVTFHAEAFGCDTNPVVVVIHGGPGNDYRNLLALNALADNYYVVFYDQRGTGLSPRVDAEQLSLENSLLDLERIVNYYAKDKKVNLIGHSWGAMLASGYICRNPERVNKAVLAEPGMLSDEQAKIFAERFKIEPNWPVIKQITKVFFESMHVKKIDDQARIDFIFNTISKIDIKGNPLLKYFCNEKATDAANTFWRLSGMSSQAIIGKSMGKDGEMQIDLTSGLENYIDTVLFLCGECNQIIGPEFQKKHMEYFSCAKMEIINDAGHNMLFEKSDACLAVINTFFKN